MKRKNLLFLLLFATLLVASLFTISCKGRELQIEIDESALSDDRFIPFEFKDNRATALARPTVSFNFTKEIDFSSLSPNKISVREFITNQEITDFTVSANYLANSFSITFSSKLQENKKYVVSINDISDIYGRSITLETNFWTSVFAAIVSHYPLAFSTAKAYQEFNVVFENDLELDESTLTSANILCHDKSDESLVPLSSILYNNATKTLTFSVPTLQEGKTYELSLLPTILDKDQYPIVPYNFTFTALSNQFISSSKPIVELSNVALTVKVQLFEDLKLDTSSLSSSSFYIKDSQGNAISATPNYRANTNSVVLTYSKDSFKEGLVYTLVVTSDLKSKNGSSCAPFERSYIYLNGSFIFEDCNVGQNFSGFSIEKTYGDDPRNPGYVFVFKDDFDKAFSVDVQTHEADGRIEKHNAAPDPEKWDLITDHSGFPSPGGTNGWYKAQQVKVEDGRLKIFAEQKSGTLNVRPANPASKVDFTRVAGRVQSKQHWGFLYGKFQVKFKPSEPTTWPAIWLLANSERPRDEMDFIEYYPGYTPKGWDSVYWGGCGWGGGKEYGRVYNNGAGLGLNFYEHDNDATMTWEELPNDKSTISVYVDMYNYKTNNIAKSGWIMNETNMDARFMRPMYPIIEIQLNGYGVKSDGDWNRDWKGTPKTLEVDYLYVSQKKNRRYATFIDEFFTLDNVVASKGIRKAKFEYPNVEGHNYGYFQYGNQPLYETNLIVVDEQYKNDENYIIYRVKNVKDVTLTAYFHPDLPLPWSKVAIDTNTHMPKEPISSYAIDPNYDFFLEAASSLNGPWTPVDFDARWDGRDDPNQFTECMVGNFKAKYYEKHTFPERTYNYIKVKFPKVGINYNKILLSKVVFTRYEGTDFSNYKIEGEQ